MKIKVLKEYLNNFNEEATVAVSMWDSRGGHTFVPNIPCCDPIKFTTKDTKEDVAVIGCFDYSQAYMIKDPRVV